MTTMTLLYNDDFAPITTTMGFLATDIQSATETYTSWVGGIEAQFGRKLTKSEKTGPLNLVLPALLPLTTAIKTKALLVPTAGPWVAYFDNFAMGTDASPVMGHMARLLKTRSVSITAISDEREQARSGGKRDAATIFELFEPHDTDWLNVGRSISMANDGGWVFETGGTQQPFEDAAFYSKAKVKDRFPVELLDTYLKALGIYAFDPDFYLPAGTTALLLEKTGQFPRNIRELSLAESFARLAS